MSLVNSIKHAPKWSYFTAAGLVGGGVLIYTIKHRNAPDPTTADTSQTDTTGTNSGQWDSSPSTVPGIVVPPIISGDNGGGGNSGYQPDASVINSYTGAIGGVLDTVGAIATGQQQLIGAILTGGGAPATPAPSGATSAPAPTPPASNPGCSPSACGSVYHLFDSSRAHPGNCNAGCYKIDTQIHCVTQANGKKRKYKRTFRNYYQGPSMTISDTNTGQAC